MQLQEEWDLVAFAEYLQRRDEELLIGKREDPQRPSHYKITRLTLQSMGSKATFGLTESTALV